MIDLNEHWNSIYQKLEADWSLTYDSWDDSVHEGFHKKYVQRLKDCIIAYLQGRCGSLEVRGVGLIDLVRLIEECGQRLSELTGTPFLPANADESHGNDYTVLDEPLLRPDGRVKKKYRNEREEEILTNETDEIIYDRQHPRRYKSIFDI